MPQEIPRIEIVSQVEASELPSIEELKLLSDEIADEYEVSRVTLRNLVQGESEWDIWADNGVDRGIVQINKTYFPSEWERAYDYDFSLRFAAKKLSEGKEYMWTVCNCYSLVQTHYKAKIPKMADIKPNSVPIVGSIAIFDYNGIKHIAYVKKLYGNSFEVDEANLKPCLRAPRRVLYTDKSLVGFHVPTK